MGGEAGTPFTKDQLAVIADDVEGGVIPRCGHMITEEQPAALAEHLIGFFAKHG